MSEASESHSINGPADLFFSGGPILTMDANRPRAEAVAVRDGRILGVGTADELSALISPDTEKVDLEGRALLPGLIDPHMHSSMVQLADWTDVSPMTRPTANDVFTALRDAVPASTGWVLAQQFDPSITGGHPELDRYLLDRLVPHSPALVLESNGHIAYANSEALARAGVDRDAPDPPAGRYTRDADGVPTGRLEESSALAAFGAGLPFATGDALAGRIRDLLWHAASQGVTLLHDCGIGSIDGTSDLDVLRTVLDAASRSDTGACWSPAAMTTGWRRECARGTGTICSGSRASRRGRMAPTKRALVSNANPIWAKQAAGH